MVELVGVRKRYRRVGEVLRGVDLRPEAGVVTVLAGANGTGKSTLLRIAAGAASPSSGRVRGRPAVVGYLPAPFPASSRLSARAYLRHAAAMHGAPDATGSALLAELGFDGALDGPATECSTGNAQKVGLVQALAPAPGLLVLDEPWTGLDDDAAAALSRRLVEAAGSATVLVADHSGRGAALPGAVVLTLDDGVLHAAPPPPGAQHPSARAQHSQPRAAGTSGRSDGPEVPVAPGGGRGEPGGRTVIELRCPGSPDDTVRRLPPVDAARCDGVTVAVEVEATRGDAVLAAALAAGCSVLAVRREP